LKTNFGIPTKLFTTSCGAQFLPLIGWRRSTFAHLPREKLFAHILQGGRSLRCHQLKGSSQGGDEIWLGLVPDPRSLTGAIGLAQFEPSSLKDAVDGNGDGEN